MFGQTDRSMDRQMDSMTDRSVTRQKGGQTLIGCRPIDKLVKLSPLMICLNRNITINLIQLLKFDINSVL